MSTAIALWNVVGKAQDTFTIAVIPLHGHINGNAWTVTLRLCRDSKHIRMQNRFCAVDVFDKPFYTTRERKVLFLALTLVNQTNLDAIVQERQFTQSLGQDLVMIFNVLEDLTIGQIAHFGTGFIGRANYLQGFYARATRKFHLMDLTIATNGQTQPFGQCVYAGYTHAVQAARHFIGVLIELAAGVQFCHHDFSRAAVELVTLVYVSWNTTTVIGHGNGIVGVNGHHDIIAISRQRFVDRVVHHFENHVVQTGAIRCIANVHAGALAHGLQALEHSDGIGAVFVLLNWLGIF